MALGNAIIAQQLRNYAAVLALEGADSFKIKAYRRAAQTLDTWPQQAADLLARGEDLQQLPNIGKGLSAVIGEIVRTGQMPQLERAKQSLDPIDLELSEWPKLDHKKVRRVYKKLGISTVEELRAKLNDGTITEALGSSLAFHIRRGLDQEVRMLWWDARKIADSIVEFLRATRSVTQIEITGEWRRRQPIVSNLDFLVSSESFRLICHHLLQFGGIQQLHAAEDRAAFRLSGGLAINLIWTTAQDWGLKLLLTTGSSTHVENLQAYGRAQGIELSTSGLTAKKNETLSEEKIYQAFNLHYIEPELREGHGEVTAAARAKLPRLISHADIKGDLHAHTTASDGSNTIEEMVRAAQELGYEYLAITDHSQSLKIAHGLSEQALREHLKAIDQLNKKLKGFTILKSAEVDILADGSLDYPDELLKELDLTICSIHSRFKLNKVQQTERLLRAMDNPYFNILGHATGRLLLSREGYEIDFVRVLAHAKSTGCYFEINANPQRLDLSEENCRLAKAAGVPIAINTDAHAIREFQFIEAGIDHARRAWFESGDVLNTLSVVELRRRLRRA